MAFRGNLESLSRSWFTISRFCRNIEQSRCGNCTLITRHFAYYLLSSRVTAAIERCILRMKIAMKLRRRERTREREIERERERWCGEEWREKKRRGTRGKKDRRRSRGEETVNLSGFFTVTSLRDSAAFRVLSCLHPCNDIHRAIQRISRIDLALWLLLRYAAPRLRPSFVCF